MFKSARIQRRVWRLEKTCCHSNFSETPSVNAGGKDLQKSKIIPYNNQQKKGICKIVNFAVPVDHRINLKECAKKNKYLNLARELKTLWNMKATSEPIVIGAFGAITKGLLKGLEDLEVGRRVGTIQMTALLRTARILET